MRDPNFVADLLMKIAAPLVDHEEAVSIRVEEGGEATLLHLTVAAQDVSNLTGPQGRTIRSIRYVLAGISSASGRKYKLELVAQDQMKDLLQFIHNVDDSHLRAC